MRRLALFCGGFAAAVLWAVEWPQKQWAFCALLLSICAGFGLLLARKQRMVQRISLILLGMAVGLSYAHLWTEDYTNEVAQLAGETHEIHGVVTQWPTETDYGYSLIVELQLEDAPALTTLLYVDEVGENIQPGDEIFTIARLKDASYTSVGEEITYYNAKGIFLYGTTYGAVEVVRPDRVPISLLPAMWSRRLEEGIEATFSAETAPLITALVTGNRESLADEFTSSLQRTGLSHTVVVSGMHLAFLAGILTLLLGRNRRRTALTIIPISILFALVVGGSPSIIRATIMIVVLQLAPLFQREADGATSLGLALLLILWNNPYAITHLGLQLSFASVAGIFCCADWIYTRLVGKIPMHFGRSTPAPMRAVGYMGKAIVATVSATLGAMVFTVPLVAYYFDYVSLIAPISNLLTLWAVAFCFAGGMVTGGLAMVSLPLASGVAQLVEPLAGYLDWMITLLGRIPYAALPTTSMFAVGWLVLIYVILCYCLICRWKIAVCVPISAVLIGLCLTIFCYVEENCQGTISVSVLDVGQGQSVLLRMGDTLALVDCGGSEDELTGDIAADAIQGCGAFYLDYLILTHCHTDHAVGVAQLMDRMDIGTLVLPATEGEDEGLRSEILAEASERAIPILFVDGTHLLEMDEGTITLFPPLGDGDENERGLTALATYSDFDVLITGDMGAEIEAKLVEYTPLPPVELYLVGHHGSKYSTSQLLLDSITPEMAVISVGKNSFGHPTDEVLERLGEMGTEIYRTDLMGTVTVRVG